MKSNLLITSSLTPEISPFLKTLPFQKILKYPFPLFTVQLPHSKIYLLISGVGTSLTHQNLSTILNHYPISQAISIGISGALCPQLTYSQIVLQKNISQPHIQQNSPHTIPLNQYPSSKLYQSITSLLNLHHIPFIPLNGLSIPKPASSPTQKSSLYQKYHAHLVDMETFPIASQCLEKNIPLSSIRIIFDLASENLPDFSPFINPFGQLEPFKLFKIILASPSTLKTLTSSAFKFKPIQKKITHILTLILQKLPITPT